ncbi:MAG: nicotinamide riboside transporter PnuC [Chlorobi bacterium]|nr:nicotinamide riboside transporter PnuC [Chlorobiota bacterium]
MSWIEWTATALGIAYVVLMIRRNIWCWVAGNIGVALQAISFYAVRLYADTLLQVIYFAMGCYGFWIWKTRPADRQYEAVTAITRVRTWLWLSLAWIAGSVLWASVLIAWTDAALPEADAALATASLVATWMQAHRYVENWLLWIVIDAAYAAVYWTRGLYLYVFLYGVFAGMAWTGWRQWRSLLKEQRALAGRS